jgi:hypothetical protein
MTRPATSTREPGRRTVLAQVQKGMLMSDHTKVGPGMHEDAAQNRLDANQVERAQVHALLAIASAVNRLANAMESVADSQRHGRKIMG